LQGETRGAVAAGRAPLIADVTLRLTRCPPSRLPPALSPSALSPSLLLLPSPPPNPPNPRLDAGSWKPPEAPPLSLPLCFSLSASLRRSLVRALSPSLLLSFSSSLPPHGAQRAVLQIRLVVDGLARPLSLSRSVCLLRALSCARARTLSLSLLPSALCEKLSLLGTWPDFEPFRLSRLYGMGFRVRTGPLGARVSVTLCPR